MVAIRLDVQHLGCLIESYSAAASGRSDSSGDPCGPAADYANFVARIQVAMFEQRLDQGQRTDLLRLERDMPIEATEHVKSAPTVGPHSLQDLLGSRWHVCNSPMLGAGQAKM